MEGFLKHFPGFQGVFFRHNVYIYNISIDAIYGVYVKHETHLYRYGTGYMKISMIIIYHYLNNYV